MYLRQHIFTWLLLTACLANGPIRGWGNSDNAQAASGNEIQLINKDDDTSLWSRLRQLPELKRRFSKIQSAYRELQTSYDQLLAEWERSQRLIALQQNKVKTMEELWTLRQQAWRRLYQPQGQSPVIAFKQRQSTFAQQSGSLYDLTQAEDHELGSSKMEPGWWNRYQIWRMRVLKLLADYQQLQQTKDLLQAALVSAQDELAALEIQLAAVDQRMRDTTRAWRRIYTE
jgi:hypothetical protein